MRRETRFKEGAWIDGFEYHNEAQLKDEIERYESLLYEYKTEFAIRLGMNNPDGNAEELFFEFEELWEALQDTMFRLSDLYVIEGNKDYINNGESE